MIVDLTRINGFDWMRKDKDFPIKLLDQVRLSREETSDFAPALSKEFLDIQATINFAFILKCVPDMTRTYSQMYHEDKYSEHS